MQTDTAHTDGIRISVVIPVYNNDQFLDECLASVTQQSLNQIEIIIVNDCSTDNSPEIIKQHAVADNRIHIISLDHNMGVSVARNTGIEHAHGDYIIFIDADDYWLTNSHLESVYNRAIADNADIVRFGFCRQTARGDRTGFKTEADATIELASNNTWTISYSIWSILISKNLLDRHNIRFSPDLIMGEDALFCCAAYCYASRLSTMNSTAYCYRINPYSVNNISWGKFKLFCTVRWFRQAIDVIQGSPAYSYRPELLQTLIAERLKMLTDKLAAMAIAILSDNEFDEYIHNWASCLSFADNNIIDSYFCGTRGKHYLNILNYVMTNNLAALTTAIQADAEMNTSSSINITLDRLEAARIGKILLNQTGDNISCDLGNGRFITLSRSKARHLARVMIENQKPRITLNFQE